MGDSLSYFDNLLLLIKVVVVDITNKAAFAIART